MLWNLNIQTPYYHNAVYMLYYPLHRESTVKCSLNEYIIFPAEMTVANIKSIS